MYMVGRKSQLKPDINHITVAVDFLAVQIALLNRDKRDA